MKLDVYLKLVGKTTDDFGAVIGVDGSSVRRYCAGLVLPRPTTAARIKAESGGAVTFDDLVEHYNAVRSRRLQRADMALSEAS